MLSVPVVIPIADAGFEMHPNQSINALPCFQNGALYPIPAFNSELDVVRRSSFPSQEPADGMKTHFRANRPAGYKGYSGIHAKPQQRTYPYRVRPLL